MKRRLQTSLLAAAVASLLALPAWSAEPGANQDPQTHTPAAAETAPDFGNSGVTEPTPDMMTGQESQTLPELQMGQDDPQHLGEQNPVYQLTPNELSSMEVINTMGETVGKVDSVVVSKTGAGIQAIISTGGILGIGDTEVAVSLDELNLNASNLTIGATEEDLKSRGDYEADTFVRLEPGDKPISEFSAFELVPEEETPAPDSPTAQPDEGTPMPAEPSQAPEPDVPENQSGY